MSFLVLASSKGGAIKCSWNAWRVSKSPVSAKPHNPSHIAPLRGRATREQDFLGPVRGGGWCVPEVKAKKLLLGNGRLELVGEVITQSRS